MQDGTSRPGQKHEVALLRVSRTYDDTCRRSPNSRPRGSCSLLDEPKMKHFDTSPDGIAKILTTGESKWVEFKSQLPPDDVISRHVVALANTQGGIVIFGVGDRGTILGIPEDRVRPAIEQLTRLSSSLLPVPAEVGAVSHKGRTLLYIVVPPVPEEYRPLMTARGEIYVRSSDKIIRNELAQKLARITRPPNAKAPQVVAFVAMSFRDEEEPALADYFA